MKRFLLLIVIAALAFFPILGVAGGNKDLHHAILGKRVISPVAVSNNTAQVGQIIDGQNYGGVEYVIATGTNADNDATFTVLLEDCAIDNCSDAAAVPDNTLFGTEATASWTGADNNAIKSLGYKGAKRYTRLTVTPAANSSACYFGVTAILGYPRIGPTQ